MARGAVTSKAAAEASAGAVGPPLLVLFVGYACALASIPLIAADGIALHVIGYVIGALIPILVIGFVRRIDLARRRSPGYQPKAWLGTALAVLAVLAIVIAGLHVWPVATELSS